MNPNFAALMLIFISWCNPPMPPPPPAPPPMVCGGDQFSMLAEYAAASAVNDRVVCTFRTDSGKACCIEWLDKDTPRIVCRGDADACLVVEP